MAYHIDLELISLEDFKQRLQEADLLPSQKILKEEPDQRFDCLKKHNIKNMLDLQKALKTKAKVQSFAKESGVPEKYLIIMRREVNSYQPKPNNFKDIPGIEPEVLAKLSAAGIKHTRHLFDKILTPVKRKDFSLQTGIPLGGVEILAKMTDLSRIKWVGPIFTRLLIQAGYDTAEKVSLADFGELHKTLTKLNEEKKYYKGQLGLNDMKLCVKVAKDVPCDILF